MTGLDIRTAAGRRVSDLVSNETGGEVFEEVAITIQNEPSRWIFLNIHDLVADEIGINEYEKYPVAAWGAR